MREIKFRAWAKDTKEMIPWEEAMFPEWFECGDIIMMQYTGLKDKNGKEIYEGDIIGKWGRAIWVVLWDELYGKYMFGKNNKGVFGFTKAAANSKKIYGNIYENPELLEAK